MCKYCLDYFKNDGNIDGEPVIDFHPTPLKSDLISLYASVWIETNGIMDIYISNSYGDGHIIAKKKIKYCPMCGKRLKREE